MGKFNIGRQVNGESDGNINNDINIASNTDVNIDSNDNINGDDKFIFKRRSKLKNKPRPVQLYFPSELLTKIDNFAKASGQSRNDTVMELLKYAVDRAVIVEEE